MEIDFQEVGIATNKIDEKLQLNIFRIIQEQLSNISKHSKATKINIKLNGNENEVILFISDNGIGCNLNKRNNGIGIKNIKSRAELHQGTALYISKPGKGYSLTVRLPMNMNKCE